MSFRNAGRQILREASSCPHLTTAHPLSLNAGLQQLAVTLYLTVRHQIVREWYQSSHPALGKKTNKLVLVNPSNFFNSFTCAVETQLPTFLKTLCVSRILTGNPLHCSCENMWIKLLLGEEADNQELQCVEDGMGRKPLSGLRLRNCGEDTHTHRLQKTFISCSRVQSTETPGGKIQMVSFAENFPFTCVCMYVHGFACLCVFINVYMFVCWCVLSDLRGGVGESEVFVKTFENKCKKNKFMPEEQPGCKM